MVTQMKGHLATYSVDIFEEADIDKICCYRSGLE